MQFELTDNEPEQQNETQWVKWYDSVKVTGDIFTIPASKMVFKDNDQPVFFIFDEANNLGCSVFAAHHPNAKFTDSTPDGIRLANAIGRHFKLTGSINADDLCSAINNADNVSIKVEKTEKGRLWSVVETAPAKKGKK